MYCVLHCNGLCICENVWPFSSASTGLFSSCFSIARVWVGLLLLLLFGFFILFLYIQSIVTKLVFAFLVKFSCYFFSVLSSCCRPSTFQLGTYVLCMFLSVSIFLSLARPLSVSSSSTLSSQLPFLPFLWVFFFFIHSNFVSLSLFPILRLSHSIHVHFISYLITAIHICFPVAFLFHSLDFLSCFSILQLNHM